MKNVSIVIPSLDPDENLVNVVSGLRGAGFDDIIIINDGSAAERLHFYDEAAEGGGVTVLTHEENKGKGTALKTAIKWMTENRPDSLGAVTADSDGQHTVEDIAAVAEELASHPDSIVMGSRNFDEAGIPARSRFGNKATRTVLRMSTGLRLSDTQTGLRGLPSCRFGEMLEIEGERYEFEMNMLVYAGRNNVPIRELPIKTVYINGNISSKFRVVADSLRIYRVFAFTLNSLLSTLLELVIFTLLNWLLDMTGVPTSIKLLISTVVSRVCSSVVNYTINKKAVFSGGGKWSIHRYYVLWFAQMGASYGLVYLFVRLTGATGVLKTVVKMCVDVTLFFAGYFVQKNWVFKNDNK
ncbi:MAG: glycosyltransferase family 2 protein [Clostridia bacterium]|nr:glycosyltransferase family 2 protein [Clostridia bacterium]